MDFKGLIEQYHALEKEIDYSISQVCQKATFIGGEEIDELEKKLAFYTNTKHCICCGNGTDALIIALMAIGVSTKDVVFVPNFTFIATAECAALLGAKIVFVDVDERTFNISPESLLKAIEKIRNDGKYQPKCVISVDLFGLPAQYNKIIEICKSNDLVLIEDGAQGFGGEIRGQKACSFGDISTTSFFPSKPLGCYGDGGAIFTNSDEYNELIRSYCVHGKGENKYDNVRIGMNSRLDTLQAAILIVKLKAFIDYEIESVNRIADVYNMGFTFSDVVIPFIPNGYLSNRAQYTIKLPQACDRVKLRRYLENFNIPTQIYYSKVLSKQIALRKYMIDCVDLSNSISVAGQVLSLPIHPYMQEKDAEYVVEKVNGFLDKSAWRYI